MIKRGALLSLFLIGLIVLIVAGVASAQSYKDGDVIDVNGAKYVARTGPNGDKFFDPVDKGDIIFEGDLAGKTVKNIGTASSFTDTGSLSQLFSLDASGNLANWIQAYEKGQGVSVVLIKYLFLVMIIMLVYSAFTYAGFPQNAATRMILTVIFSILATILIDPNELVSIVRSYTAAGIALSLVIPIIVLGFITFAVAVKVSSVGIVMQRILWAFYSVYLFISAGGAWLIAKTNGTGFDWIAKIFTFLGGSGAQSGQFGDSTIILLIEFVASIIIFFTLVLNNQWFVDYLIADVREAKAKKSGDITKKAKTREKQLAGSLEDNN